MAAVTAGTWRSRLLRRRLRVPGADLRGHARAAGDPTEAGRAPTFTSVTEGVESVIGQAKTAAGDKLVQVVGGPNLIQQLLDAGLVDELRVDVMPVVLGGGLRLLETSIQSA